MHIDKGISVYGAGYGGAMLVELFQSKNIPLICIMDRNPAKQGKAVFGIPVYEPHYIETDLIVVSLLEKGKVYCQIKESLINLGYKTEQVIHVYDLENIAQVFEKQKLVIKPDKEILFKRIGDWKKIRNILADEESLKVYDAAYSFLTGNTDPDFITHPLKEQYFDYEIYKKIDNETVIDCGGFKGNVMRTFLENNKGVFDKYIIIEPDKRYINYIIENEKGFDESRIEIKNLALTDCFKKLFLTNYMDMNSVVSEYSTCNTTAVVQGERLDEICSIEECSFLKIDVEGYELKLLKGARRLIQKTHPVIAVAVYHHELDLADISQKILEYYMDYTIYLRSYMNYQEMIMYAIPKDRMVKDKI